MVVASLNSLILRRLVFLAAIVWSPTGVWSQDKIGIPEFTDLARDVRTGTPFEFNSFSEIVFGEISRPVIDWFRDEQPFCVGGVGLQKASKLISSSISVTKLTKLVELDEEQEGLSPTGWTVYTGSISSCTLSTTMTGRVCSTNGDPVNAYYDIDSVVYDNQLHDIVWEDLTITGRRRSSLGSGAEREEIGNDQIQEELEKMLKEKVRRHTLHDLKQSAEVSPFMVQAVYSVGLAAVEDAERLEKKRTRSIDRGIEL